VRLAFAFEEPRPRVIIETPASPTARRPTQAGRRKGGFAPMARASSGSQTDALRGIVVHDVVDAGRSALGGEARHLGHVVHVDERPDPGSASDHGEPAPPHHLQHVAACAERRARPVEAAVAQDHSHHVGKAGDGGLEPVDALQGLPHRGRWIGIERVLFRLHPTADSLVRPARVALGDEAADARGPRRRDKVVRALGSQAVRDRELAVDVPQVLEGRERGHLMDDDLGTRVRHRLADRFPVQGVQDHRLRPHRAQRLRPACAARGGHDLVAGRHQHGDEPPAHHARPARQEDLHLCTSSSHIPGRDRTSARDTTGCHNRTSCFVLECG